MTDYRRITVPGASYFFTVNCEKRTGQRLLVDHIDRLGEVFRKVKAAHPFEIDAIVVLPEHLHCIWSLPPGDADYRARWSLIKAGFSRGVPTGEGRSRSRIKRGERGIWQRRYWEHLIRNEEDHRRHLDYIHWNPVKHGWVARVRDWPYSSFHAFVRRGALTDDWGCEPEMGVNVGEGFD